MNHEWSVSRREWLKRVGAAAAVSPRILLPLITPGRDAVPVLEQAPGGTVAALEMLTASESETLTAIAARLIPSDNSGPGASEARAAQYIDRALGGALASFRDAYRAGLAAVERYAQSSKGNSFARLSAADQDALLRDVERNVATGFSTDPSTFFNLVLGHTIQGTFCDPHYGGNANFVGWDLIGYPGVRLAVTSAEQGLNARPSPTHMSAYDYRMFSSRRPARAALDREGGHHGE